MKYELRDSPGLGENRNKKRNKILFMLCFEVENFDTIKFNLCANGFFFSWMLCLVPIGVYGIQHYVSMLGSLILIPLVMVPAMGGSRVSDFEFLTKFPFG